MIIEQLERWLEVAEQMREEVAEQMREEVAEQMREEDAEAEQIERLEGAEECGLGHLVLSPPISLNVGEEGYTEAWAVIEEEKSKLDSTNFTGNVIDLSTDIDIDEFTAWMYPHLTNPPSFEYPGDCVHKVHGTIPDVEILKPNPNAHDHEPNTVIMVMKHGQGTGLTVRCLNTICSFTRHYFKGEPAVVDAKGRLAGLLTGGAGTTNMSDCTYIMSISFIYKHMLLNSLEANFFPSLQA
ncbi:hypothetical protein F5141DRAFT_1221984 [Pisolithus sp. B1]|nr:hypothetical protein F5141DRAFT_1221984 [Pisolithus sp. B1]